MSDCLFCKIVEGKIPAKKIYEDEKSLAFRDINPQAPVHFLVIPKKHIPTLLEASEEPELIGYLAQVIKKVAAQEGLDGEGFRSVVNVKEQGGQTVYHLHFHVLGGRFMKWPPG
ncbi:MAG: histidine triad nucleotide-binding protein [Bdellovibrionota bacterium]